MPLIHRLKESVKSTPVLGPLLIRMYIAAAKARPSYFGRYYLKPRAAGALIGILRSWLPVPGLTIRNGGTIVDTGDARFNWIPEDPYSLLGYPLRGDFEPDETRLAMRFAERSRVIIDVGGNFGWYACHLASVMTSGEIHIFEPVPAMMEELTENLALNAKSGVRPVLNGVCLSDDAGETEFFIPEKLGAAFASLALPVTGPKCRKIRVRTTTLDAYCEEKELGPVDLLKIDVEGAELLVLKGATKLLNGPSKPAILIEIQDASTVAFGHSARDVIRFIRGIGYRSFIFPEAGGMEALEGDEPVGGYNFLFVHQPAHIKLASEYALDHPARNRGQHEREQP